VLGSAAVYYHQRATITDLVFDYGGTMAEVIATESAEDLLLGDWVAVQAMVEDMQRNRQMAYLRIVDRNGEVVASSDSSEVGRQAVSLFEGETMAEGREGRRVGRYRDGESERFLFQSPIVYRDQAIGGLALGISARPVSAALRTSLMAMAALMVATVLTVLLGSYMLSRRLSMPLRLIGSGLDRVAGGDVAYRIRLRRRDEFGELYARYNLMAEALQARQAGRASDLEPDSGEQGTEKMKTDGDASESTQKLP